MNTEKLKMKCFLCQELYDTSDRGMMNFNYKYKRIQSKMKNEFTYVKICKCNNLFYHKKCILKKILIDQELKCICCNSYYKIKFDYKNGNIFEKISYSHNNCYFIFLIFLILGLIALFVLVIILFEFSKQHFFLKPCSLIIIGFFIIFSTFLLVKIFYSSSKLKMISKISFKEEFKSSQEVSNFEVEKKESEIFIENSDEKTNEEIYDALFEYLRNEMYLSKNEMLSIKFDNDLNKYITLKRDFSDVKIDTDSFHYRHVRGYQSKQENIYVNKDNLTPRPVDLIFIPDEAIKRRKIESFYFANSRISIKPKLSQININLETYKLLNINSEENREEKKIQVIKEETSHIVESRSKEIQNNTDNIKINDLAITSKKVPSIVKFDSRNIIPKSSDKIFISPFEHNKTKEAKQTIETTNINSNNVSNNVSVNKNIDNNNKVSRKNKKELSNITKPFDKELIDFYTEESVLSLKSEGSKIQLISISDSSIKNMTDNF